MDVSVILPTRNRWPLLRQAMISVLAQDGVAVELIVVDEGSTDETPVRLAELADPRVTVIRHAEAQGVSAARNAGARAAQATWVAFLDDDDFWAPDKLRRQLAAVRREQAAWAWTAMLVVDDHLRCAFVRPAEAQPALLAILMRRNIVGTPSSVLVRRDALEAAGGFDEHLSVLADWDLWIRLAQRWPAAAVNLPLMGHRAHGGSMQRRLLQEIRSEQAHMAGKHAALTAEYGSLGGYEFWAWLARLHRDIGQRRVAAGLYLRLALRHRDPRTLLQALGVVLGERAMGFGRRRRPLPDDDQEWLADWRALADGLAVGSAAPPVAF